MDTNSKNLAYNNSTYAQRLAQKQAIFAASRYGQNSTAGTSGSTSSTGITYYTLPDGKVLARNTESKYIDFKSLFSFLDDDENNTITGIGNYQEISNNLLSAYEKIAKQNLGLH